MKMADSRRRVRLSFPQWQGAHDAVVRNLLPEVPLERGQFGYNLGSRLLEVIAPTEHLERICVPVSDVPGPFAVEEGIYARDVILHQLRAVVAKLQEEAPDEIVVVGGDCSVSVAPFAYLADRYRGDVAILWVDAHPDTSLPGMVNAGFHSMAVSALVGAGDPELIQSLPGHVPADRVLQVGTRSWYPDEIGNRDLLGVQSVAAAELRADPQVVVNWLEATGASHVLVHLDLDVLDGSALRSVMGPEPDGLMPDDVVGLLGVVQESARIVGLTVAEYVPRDALVLQDLLERLPLLGWK